MEKIKEESTGEKTRKRNRHRPTFMGFVLMDRQEWDKSSFVERMEQSWGIRFDLDERSKEDARFFGREFSEEQYSRLADGDRNRMRTAFLRTDTADLIVMFTPQRLPNDEAETAAEVAVQAAVQNAGPTAVQTAAAQDADSRERRGVDATGEEIETIRHETERITKEQEAFLIVIAYGTEHSDPHAVSRLYLQLMDACLNTHPAIGVLANGCLYRADQYREFCKSLQAPHPDFRAFVRIEVGKKSGRILLNTVGLKNFGLAELARAVRKNLQNHPDSVSTAVELMKEAAESLLYFDKIPEAFAKNSGKNRVMSNLKNSMLK